MTTYQLRTLGRLELEHEGRLLLPRRRKLLCLLAYLARHSSVSIPRGRLAALFWPEAGSAHARQSLRQALSTLRAVVGAALAVTQDSVTLMPGTVVLDASTFEAEIEGGHLTRAEARWHGDFLSEEDLGAGEDLRAWLEAEREYLRQRRSTLGRALVSEAEFRGAWRRASLHAERWKADLPGDLGAQAHLRRLHALRRPRPGMDAETPGTRALDMVGRETEFLALTSLWRTVEQGQAGLAHIHGPAGRGKTRLTEEFLHWGGTRRPRTVVVRAQGQAGVEGLLATVCHAPGIVAAPATALRTLAAFVPDFAARFPGLPDGPRDPVPIAVVRAITELAAEAPVIVAVDDADAADPELIEALEAICRQGCDGVLLLLTSRPGALPEGLGPRPGAKTHASIPLAPLKAEDVAQTLEMLGCIDPVARRHLAMELVAEVGGDPSALMETLPVLASRGTWPASEHDGKRLVEGLPVPRSIRTAAFARLHASSADAMRVAHAASLLPESTLRSLGCLVCLSEARVSLALDELVARGVLVRSSAREPLRFESRMLQRAILADMPQVRRSELEQRLRTKGARKTGSRWMRAARAAAAVLALVLVSPVGTGGREPLPSIAVTRVEASAPSEADDLAATVDLALRVAFEQARGIRLIDRLPRPSTTDRARRAGARFTVDGRIDRVGDGLRLQLALRDAAYPDYVAARATVEGSDDELALLAAKATTKLFPRDADGYLSSLRAARSRSLSALRSYLTGIRLGQRRQFALAEAEHSRAVRLDPMFVAAWHALASARMRRGRLDSAAAAFREGVRRAEGAGDPEFRADLAEIEAPLRALDNGIP